MVAPLIKGGKPREYLAHWLPEGGYDTIPALCGDGFLIAGDSAMLFNAPHREGSNLAMASGRSAAETIVEALRRGDFSRRGLEGYAARLKESFVIQDMKKYRHFPGFLDQHHELFTTLPAAAAFAAREMIRVDGVPKRQKQKAVLTNLHRQLPLRGWIRLLWDGWRAFK
jgi:electron transfer flavoprotein-quinone oxidoreductase